MTLRVLTLEDLPAVARLHRMAFTDSALTWLGAGAVRRYYHWLLTGPHACVALGQWQAGVMVGFCVGGLFKGALRGFLRKNRAYLVTQVVVRPWLVFKPLVRQRLRSAGIGFRGLSRSARRPQRMSVSAATQVRSFGILSIAVNPLVRRVGVGRMLMQAMETEACRQDFPQMDLSVHLTNWEAIRFYERLGWMKVEEDGRWRGVMIKRLGVPE